MKLSPGLCVGAYEVLAPAGAGGMGEVYRARDTRLGREVALKVLPQMFSADPERLARFEREAQVLAFSGAARDANQRCSQLVRGTEAARAHGNEVNLYW